MSNEHRKKTIILSDDLFSRIEERADAAGFDSVNEYVQFVLEEILKEEGEQETPFSKDEEEMVKKRLRALGYIE